MATTAYLTDHERLDAWQRAMDLLVEAYGIARLLPVEERYGLASQIRRAAVSIPANIAEGCGRATKADKLRFLSIARGSLCELSTLFEACKRLKFVSSEALAVPFGVLAKTRQLVGGLQRYLKAP